MAYLSRVLRPLTPFRPLAASSFHSTSIHRAMGERDLASKQDTPDLAGKREASKQDSVQKAKQGKGEWKEELASNSEESVRGEKSDMSMDEMKKMGEEKGQKDHGKR